VSQLQAVPKMYLFHILLLKQSSVYRTLVTIVNYFSPELIVLVDFKAIYPGVPPGIFASFPGVAHFLSFEEICQYPRVPQGKVANPWGTLGCYFPWGQPQGNQNTWGTFNIFKTSKHHKLFEWAVLGIFMYLLTHIFLFFFSYTSHSSLIILYFLFFSSYSSHIILLFSFFSSNYYLLTF
jgi:hypothetical protein